MALSKVRVQLLDTSTGNVLEEVDILTSADAVTFADGETFQQKLDAGKLTGATGKQGPAGKDGATGAKGEKGEKGDNAIWHFVNSTGAPANTLGTIGDWAINTAGQTYEKTGASAWVARVNIKGKTGDPGPQGGTGATGATGPAGKDGKDGDNVKYGTSLGAAQEIKLFFKKI